MGENNWLLVKFQVKDPKKVPLVLRGFLYLRMEAVMAKKEYRLSIEYDTDTEEIESLSEVLEQETTTNIWFDTGEEVLQMPSEILKYIEDSNGVLGIA